VRRALRIAAALSLGLPATLACAPDAPEPGPARHLVLVTVDTLRADRLGLYGYDGGTSPALDARLAGALVFDAAYAHASMTLPSVASLMTGRLPAEHGIRSNRDAFSTEWPTLATRLSEYGFRTGAFIGNYALRPSRALDRGFDHYTREFATRERIRPTPENAAPDLNAAALSWVDAQPDDARLFLWVHYQEPHGPYTPSKWELSDSRPRSGIVLEESPTHSGRGAIPRYQWLGHGRVDEYEARYEGEIRELDASIGALLDGLEARGILGEAALVFTADHGEAFGEDGLWCAHGEGLHEVLLHVPLALEAPGLAPGRRSDRVRLIDVAPTALALLGLQADDLPGRSLLDDVGDRPLVAQIRMRQTGWRTLRDGDWEISQQRGRPPVLRRLRPASGLGAGAKPEDREAAGRKLAALLEREAPWTDAAAPEAPLSPEERQGLRALGYVD
jgi:arylsulfatase